MGWFELGRAQRSNLRDHHGQFPERNIRFILFADCHTVGLRLQFLGRSLWIFTLLGQPQLKHWSHHRNGQRQRNGDVHVILRHCHFRKPDDHDNFFLHDYYNE